ncbi:MAG: M36 family metallopeptidase [Pseudomonadota bacterium]
MKHTSLKAHLSASAALLTLGFVTSTAHAQSTLAEERAAVLSDRGDFVSAVGNKKERVAAMLQRRGASASMANILVETAEFSGVNSIRHARYEQRLNGLRVHGAYVKAAFNEKGDLVHLIERTAKRGGAIAKPSLGESEALSLAIKENFGNLAAAPGLKNKQGAIATFNETDFFHQEPTVERVVIAGANSALEEGFLVETWSEDDNLLYHTLVNSLGKIVSNELRTAQDSYRVYADHPDNSSHSIVQGPGSGNGQSPNGWLSGSQSSLFISGNNARAYLDRNANNSPDGGGRSITDGNFTTSANLSQSPTTTQNQEVAVQNLFYFNNVIHDRLYRHGFTEATRNFQENNFGRGGAGSDSVNAEAQDGGGANNANFATPSDGGNPRMQMFLWTLTNPQRDGDLDSDIIWHEYGHGLTWRMIGSMSGNVPGAIGEGMSDVLAIIVNDDDRVGEYSTNNSNGIRSSRYSQHQDTIGDFNSSRGVHRNGEIIAATVWDVWTGYKNAGFDSDDILDDIVGGMNFIPSAPEYFEMRDGFLAAAPASRDCIIWEAFAARGMGVGGSMNSSGTSVNESFDVPSECGGTPPPPPPSGDGPELTSLSASAQRQSFSRWRATVTAGVSDENGNPAAGVVVGITTNVGASGSCTTASNGFCSASLSNISRFSVPSVTFTITSLDGDTNATGVPASVTVNRR